MKPHKFYTTTDHDTYPMNFWRAPDKTEIKDLETILLVESVTGDTVRMQECIKSLIKTIDGVFFETDEKGNILAWKGLEAEATSTVPAIACHIDTVHDIQKGVGKDGKSRKYVVQKIPINGSDCTKDCIYTSPTGVGGDDKCGIFIAIRLLKDPTITTLKAFFYVDEESGCVGSGFNIKNHPEWYTDVGFMIEPDRRGDRDLIFEGAGRTVSDDFVDDVNEIFGPEGFKEAVGLYTDVMRLQKNINVSCMNVSCGYWEPHSSKEEIHTSSLLRSLDMIRAFVIKYGYTSYPHVQKPLKTTSYAGSWDILDEFDDMYDGYYDDNYTYGPFKTKKLAVKTKLHGELMITMEYTTDDSWHEWYVTRMNNSDIIFDWNDLSPRMEVMIKRLCLKKWGMLTNKPSEQINL